MSSDVHIPLVLRRYRMGGAPPQLRGRLDALTEMLLRDRLPDVLAAAGLAADTLCLRDLSVRLRYRPGQSEASCLAEWTAALGRAVAAAGAQTDPGALVRLGRQVAAHLDVADGLAAGRLERAWAWKAAGLTAGDHRTAAARLAEEWQDRLTSDPVLPAVLRSLMRGGQVAALRRAGLLPAETLARLGRAALGTTLDLSDNPRLAEDVASAAAAARIAPALAPLARADVAALAHEDRAAVAVWAVAAAEPAALSQAPGALAALLGLLGQRLADPEGARRLPPPGNLDGEVADEKRVGVAASDIRASDAPPTPLMRKVPASGVPPARGPTGPDRADPLAAGTAATGTAAQPADRPVARREPGGPAPTPAPPVPEAAAPAPSAPEAALRPPVAASASAAPDGDLRVHSRFAGLVLWLNAFDLAGTVEALLADPVLAPRPFGWRVSGLVRALLPVPDTDPALAILSDRAVEDPPWSEVEAPASPAETGALAAQAAAFAAALARFLPERDPMNLPSRIATQTGRIDREPGWITFTLPLDLVATDVRRAGLDLHPGFVPWLGAVIRIAYEDTP